MRLHKVKTHEGEHYGRAFFCPGCKEPHSIPTKPHERGWDFDGDEERPTFSPSILVTWRGDDDGTPVELRCHSFVRAGRIEFLGDCTHPLAGQTVDLPEFRWSDEPGEVTP